MWGGGENSPISPPLDPRLLLPNFCYFGCSCLTVQSLHFKKRNALKQPEKKVVSDSLGLVDFAIGLVNSVLNLPDRQVKYFEEFTLYKNCEMNSAYQKLK